MKVICLMLAFASLSLAGQVRVKVITQKDDGTTVTLKNGGHVRVHLNCRPGAGEGWHVVTLPPQLKEVGKSYFDDTNTLGGTATHVHRFRAVKPGEGILQLHMKRAGSMDTKTFKVKIKVE